MGGPQIEIASDGFSRQRSNRFHFGWPLYQQTWISFWAFSKFIVRELKDEPATLAQRDNASRRGIEFKWRIHAKRDAASCGQLLLDLFNSGLRVLLSFFGDILSLLLNRSRYLLTLFFGLASRDQYRSEDQYPASSDRETQRVFVLRSDAVSLVF